MGGLKWLRSSAGLVLMDAVKLLARAHQTAIWERTRQMLRLRSTLRGYFPAAIKAFEDLAAESPRPRRGHIDTTSSARHEGTGCAGHPPSRK